MDFVKILRAFEEFLYEVLTWLLFYPRTLWRVTRRPLEMTRYSDAEQHDKAEKQYDDAISPPLFLILTMHCSLVTRASASVPKTFRSIPF